MHDVPTNSFLEHIYIKLVDGMWCAWFYIYTYDIYTNAYIVYVAVYMCVNAYTTSLFGQNVHFRMMECWHPLVLAADSTVARFTGEFVVEACNVVATCFSCFTFSFLNFAFFHIFCIFFIFLFFVTSRKTSKHYWFVLR